MPRDNPRRITRQKLLKFTGQSADCQAILAKLDRHERIVKRLKLSGNMRVIPLDQNGEATDGN